MTRVGHHIKHSFSEIGTDTRAQPKCLEQKVRGGKQKCLQIIICIFFNQWHKLIKKMFFLGNKSDKKSATKVWKYEHEILFSSTQSVYFCWFTLSIFAFIWQQPQSPKEQPKKADQKGDDNKKQGGKHLYEPTSCCLHVISAWWIKSVHRGQGGGKKSRIDIDL